MTPRAIPFLLTLPGHNWASVDTSLSAVRDWATSKVTAHSRRVGCRVDTITDWDFTAVDDDGLAAVALVAWLAPLPTIADAVAELRERPVKAAREHVCLVCRGIRHLRAAGYDDHAIAARLEMHSATAVARHINNHGRNTGT